MNAPVMVELEGETDPLEVLTTLLAHLFFVLSGHLANFNDVGL